MQVNLAGYNIDSSLIRTLHKDTATPEVISAAYARISRSPKSVTELREEALQELEKARKSNRNIIFELGHASVAEHAVFNFDVIGISRLLTETLETIRLASFTEKSQRYVTFTNDYVIPQELDSANNEKLKYTYKLTLDALFQEYHNCCEKLTKLYAAEYPALSKTDREGMAKEDARYILPLATKTQLGMTINARSLENLLKRLDANPLQEARELHRQLLEPVKEICPSLVRYTEKDSFTGSFHPPRISPPKDGFDADECVRVVNITEDPDDIILAALLYEKTSGDYQNCREQIAEMDFPDKYALWQQIFADIKPWHKMHRAFELVDFTFELRMSESCWAQFKRHRISTMIKQQNPLAGTIIIPDSIKAIKRGKAWNDLVADSRALSTDLRKVFPDLSPYARLNADKVKVLVKMNLRELYHFVRLRSDAHAQWEIRALSNSMVQYLHIFCPHSAAFLSGKSEMQS